MKKTFIFIVFIALFFLTACEKASEPKEDKIAPLLEVISGDYLSVTININDIDEDFDLKEVIKEGFTAFDDVDGIITNQIIVKDEAVDLTKVGEYNALVFVYDKAMNQSNIMIKKVIVVDQPVLLKPFPIWNDLIVGETSPAKQALFGGAWYHKVVSSEDYWLGIEGTITLPVVDLKRYQGAYNEDVLIDPWGWNLDNPSVYMGGNASSESDVGLSLSRVLLKQGGQQVLSKGSYAFRPFWRYITTTEQDVGGYDLNNGRFYAVSKAGTNNMIANWHYSYTEYYYLPGDKLRIIVFSPKPNYLQLQIEVIEKSTLASSILIREQNEWKDPENFLSPIFRSPGHGSNGLAHYKRVNAIDQAGNEGKTAIMTETTITNAIWESVYLHRKIDGIMYRVPFNSQRADVLGAPKASAFSYTPIDENGGSIVTIHPKESE